jgi:hypothetical protein
MRIISTILIASVYTLSGCKKGVDRAAAQKQLNELSERANLLTSADRNLLNKLKKKQQDGQLTAEDVKQIKQLEAKVKQIEISTPSAPVVVPVPPAPSGGTSGSPPAGGSEEDSTSTSTSDDDGKSKGDGTGDEGKGAALSGSSAVNIPSSLSNNWKKALVSALSTRSQLTAAVPGSVRTSKNGFSFVVNTAVAANKAQSAGEKQLRAVLEKLEEKAQADADVKTRFEALQSLLQSEEPTELVGLVPAILVDGKSRPFPEFSTDVDFVLGWWNQYKFAYPLHYLQIEKDLNQLRAEWHRRASHEGLGADQDYPALDQHAVYQCKVRSYMDGEDQFFELQALYGTRLSVESITGNDDRIRLREVEFERLANMDEDNEEISVHHSSPIADQLLRLIRVELDLMQDSNGVLHFPVDSASRLIELGRALRTICSSKKGTCEEHGFFQDGVDQFERTMEAYVKQQTELFKSDQPSAVDPAWMEIKVSEIDALMGELNNAGLSVGSLADLRRIIVDRDNVFSILMAQLERVSKFIEAGTELDKGIVESVKGFLAETSQFNTNQRTGLESVFGQWLLNLAKQVDTVKTLGDCLKVKRRVAEPMSAMLSDYEQWKRLVGSITKKLVSKADAMMKETLSKWKGNLTGLAKDKVEEFFADFEQILDFGIEGEQLEANVREMISDRERQYLALMEARKGVMAQSLSAIATDELDRKGVEAILKSVSYRRLARLCSGLTHQSPQEFSDFKRALKKRLEVLGEALKGAIHEQIKSNVDIDKVLENAEQWVEIQTIVRELSPGIVPADEFGAYLITLMQRVGAGASTNEAALVARIDRVVEVFKKLQATFQLDRPTFKAVLAAQASMRHRALN